MKRFLVASFAAAVLASSCGFATSGPSTDCPAPTLAAYAVPLALSCPELITYEGRRYHVGCAPIHSSRIGKRFLDDGGETGYQGAREIVGLERSKAFILLGGEDCGAGKALIAATESFRRIDAGLMRVPTDATRPLELARKRAPWIVPALNTIPDALKLDVELSQQTITITNRNEFTWRECQQIQIGQREDEIWETGEYVERLRPGESYSWHLTDFERHGDEIEQLSQEDVEEIEGLPFIIMCNAPGGPAFGRVRLQW